MVLFVEFGEFNYAVDAKEEVFGVWVGVDFYDFVVVFLAFAVE